jgi:hypothetical protein
MRPLPGQEGNIEAHFRKWEKERRPSAGGAVGGYLLRPRAAGADLLGVAVFDSEESYAKNANDPAQDAWYRELRAMLEGDPEWNDGDVLVAL